MVTAATANASALRSAGLYCLRPVVSAVRVVRFGPVRVAASCCTSPLLYCGGRVKRGALLQLLRALPRREGGRGWLREALHAQALRVRVVRVLSAVLRGRPEQEEELLPLRVALPAGRVVEC